ncbi:MAG: hypothetical protein ACLTMP_03855 [Eggerthella lenta]
MRQSVVADEASGEERGSAGWRGAGVVQGIAARRKRYVEVEAFLEDGRIVPRAVIWHDGRRFPCACWACGGASLRWAAGVRYDALVKCAYVPVPRGARWFVENRVRAARPASRRRGVRLGCGLRVRRFSGLLRRRARRNPVSCGKNRSVWQFWRRTVASTVDEFRLRAFAQVGRFIRK